MLLTSSTLSPISKSSLQFASVPTTLSLSVLSTGTPRNRPYFPSLFCNTSLTNLHFGAKQARRKPKNAMRGSLTVSLTFYAKQRTIRSCIWQPIWHLSAPCGPERSLSSPRTPSASHDRSVWITQIVQRVSDQSLKELPREETIKVFPKKLATSASRLILKGPKAACPCWSKRAFIRAPSSLLYRQNSHCRRTRCSGNSSKTRNYPASFYSCCSPMRLTLRDAENFVLAG